MKSEVDIINGKLKYKEKEFCFNYNDDVLTIYPDKLEEHWKSLINMFDKTQVKDKNATINLYGETSNGNPIVFIRLSLNNIGRGIYRSFVPAYILGKCNGVSPLPNINDFSKMVIKGECIDKLYNPKILIKDIDSTKKFKPIIKFNNLKDVEKEFTINNDVWKYGISWNMPFKKLNSVIELNSNLYINFDKLKNVNEIIEYYIKLEKMLCFLYNRKHIILSDIKLYKDIIFYDEIEKKNTKTFITFILKINERKDIDYDLPKRQKQLSILDLETHLESLYNEINKNPFLKEFLPKNTYDSNHIDINQFLQVTSTFESEFDRTYPNYKSKKNTNYKRIKDKVLEYLENCKVDENKYVRKYITDFYDTINNMEGTLPEQICYVLKEFAKPIEKIKQRLFVHYEITNVNNNELAQKFSQKRNSLIHGNELKEFTDIEIVSYILIERIVYCLLLKRVGFSSDEIVRIIEIIFD